MAVRSPYARARFYDGLRSGTQVAQYDGSRILSASWTEEAPTFSRSRRLGDVTVRLSNDFGTNSDGWTGPAMSAVKAEDPEALVGTYLRLYVTAGMDVVPPRALVDQVQCDDSSVTVHGTFHDVLLDRTLDEAGVSGEIASGQDMVAWWEAAAEACGEQLTGSILDQSLSAPSALSLDGSTTVRRAMDMTLAYLGRAVSLATSRLYAVPYTDVTTVTNWYGAYTWPEPANTERYGTLVVNDPSDGSSQEATLDSTQEGTLEVDVAWSSTGTPSMSNIATWARARHADQQYSAELPMELGAVYRELTNLRCASYVDGNGDTRYQTMNVNRVEGRFDGGLSATVTGTLGDVVRGRGP